MKVTYPNLVKFGEKLGSKSQISQKIIGVLHPLIFKQQYNHWPETELGGGGDASYEPECDI